MALYEFELGLTAEDMDNIEDLDGSDEIIPDWTYSDPEGVELANGKVRLLGFPLITWHYGFLCSADREIFRTICPGKSADVYLRTPINDKESGEYAYRTFQAVMVWPSGEDPRADIYQDVTFEFRFPIEQPEESI